MAVKEAKPGGGAEPAGEKAVLCAQGSSKFQVSGEQWLDQGGSLGRG